MKVGVLNVTPHRLVERYRFFGWIFCLQVQCRSGRLLRNVGTVLRRFTAWHPRKQLSSYSSNLTFYLYIQCAWKNNGEVSAGSVSKHTKGIALNAVLLYPSTQTISPRCTVMSPPPQLFSIVWSFSVRTWDLWLPRSPDLTQFYFFLFWSCVNNYVRMNKIRGLNHLKEIIR
jgi:hypothetical protein